MGQEIGTLDAGHDPGRILRMNLEIASVSQSETNSHMGQLEGGCSLMTVARL